jgi:hypothetical protein
VFLGVSFHGLFSVTSAVNDMGSRCMGVVCRLLMTSGLVMLGGFPVVAGGMGEMFRCLLVVFRSFLRHGIPPFVVSMPRLGKPIAR